MLMTDRFGSDGSQVLGTDNDQTSVRNGTEETSGTVDKDLTFPSGAEFQGGIGPDSIITDSAATAHQEEDNEVFEKVLKTDRNSFPETWEPGLGEGAPGTTPSCAPMEFTIDNSDA